MGTIALSKATSASSRTLMTAKGPVSLDTLIRSLVERSVTPFEKLEDIYETAGTIDSISYTTYLQHWTYNLSSKGGPQRLQRFLKFSDLDEADLRRMFSPVRLVEQNTFPKWASLLGEVLEIGYGETLTPSPFNSEEPLPFETLFEPFISLFRTRLKEGTGTAYYLLAPEAHREIEYALLYGLEDLIEKILLHGFSNFLNTHLGENGLEGKDENLAKDHYYQRFISQLQEDRLVGFFTQYPMLARIVGNRLQQFIEVFTRFIKRLAQDWSELSTFFGLDTPHGRVLSLNLNVADPHSGGESVKILEFESGWKVVYKPRCMEVGLAYGQFCEWVNARSECQLKVLRILARDQYGWIEFAPNAECQDEAAVERYYERAGMLLAITYLLDSNDYHAENIIAAGEHPLLVDFETILQPQMKVDQGRHLEQNGKDVKFRPDTVLRAIMLPMPIRSTKVPNDSMAGFGSLSDGSFQVYFPCFIDINTDKMREEHREKMYEITSNLPRLQGEFKRVGAYRDALSRGFSQLYQLFESERAVLLGPDSPLLAFRNLDMRFLFRSTQVYTSILSNILKPKYLADANLYGLRIEMLARPYLTKDTPPAFWKLLAGEREDMLNRDVPCFSFNSDRDSIQTHTGEEINGYFYAPCLDYVRIKLNKMNAEDLKDQLGLIDSSLNGEFNQPLEKIQ